MKKDQPYESLNGVAGTFVAVDTRILDKNPSAGSIDLRCKMDSIIARLDEKAAELSAELNRTLVALEQARMAYVVAADRFRIGSIVRYRGVDHKVLEIRARTNEPRSPFLIAAERQPNGEFAKEGYDIGTSWEVVEKSPA